MSEEKSWCCGSLAEAFRAVFEHMEAHPDERVTVGMGGEVLGTLGSWNELTILHGRRRKILQRKRLGKSWNRHDLEAIRARIDELEVAELGLTWWRQDLLLTLRRRHFDLLVVWAEELLARKRPEG